MAKLSELVNVGETNDVITLHGISNNGGDLELPIAFTMGTLDYVAEAYGKPFAQFEKEMNKMMGKEILMRGKELKILNALIYGVVRTGGTETTPDELARIIPFADMNGIAQSVMTVFNTSYFQAKDIGKLKDNDQKK